MAAPPGRSDDLFGIVRWFDAAKGYGFITTEDETELHVHRSQVESIGRATLVPGQAVRFDMDTNRSGRSTAKNLKLIGDRKTKLAQGTVRSFSSQGGYGFITAEDGTNVFVHASQVELAGLKTLERGQRVEFTSYPSPRGVVAEKLKIIR
jgi:cold shock protein